MKQPAFSNIVSKFCPVSSIHVYGKCFKCHSSKQLSWCHLHKTDSTMLSLMSPRCLVVLSAEWCSISSQSTKSNSFDLVLLHYWYWQLSDCCHHYVGCSVTAHPSIGLQIRAEHMQGGFLLFSHTLVYIHNKHVVECHLNTLSLSGSHDKSLAS